MSVSVAVIPVAGKGTRLLPLTKSVPKELLPLGRKPVLQHVVEEMQAAGARDLVMITSESKGSIKQHFTADNELEQQLTNRRDTDLLNALQFMASDTTCQFIQQDRQSGLGHAVLCAKDAVGDQPFLIALGDARMSDALGATESIGDATGVSNAENNASLCRRMIRLFEQTNADAAISFQQVPLKKVSRYGIASIQQPFNDGDEMFMLSSLVEKPTVEAAPSRYAVAARYICKPGIFDYLEKTQPGHGGEIQLTDAIQALINDGGRVIGVPLQAEEKRYDVGNFETYYTAFIEMALSDPDFGDAVKKNLTGLLQQQEEINGS